MAAAVAAIAVYAHTVGHGFVYDSRVEVVANEYIRSLAHLTEIFTSDMWAGSGGETFLYRPLAIVTYALNYQISGLSAWSYHLVNVLLHALVTVLVYRVGRSWRLPVAAAGAGALLFAVHPVHVEVTAAVFGRKDLLAAAGVLAMVLWHRRAIDRGGWWLTLPVLAFAAALLSKEVGAVGVLLVAAQDWLQRSPEQRRALLTDRRAVLLYSAYLLTLAAYLLVRVSVVGGLGVPETSYLDNPLVTEPWGIRVATALVVVGRGLVHLIWPVALSPDYSYNAIPVVHSVTDGHLLAVVCFLTLLVCALIWTRARSIVLPIMVAWYGLALLPTSNLLLPVGTIFGDRLLYLPSVAFCLMVGHAVVRLAGAGTVARTAVVAAGPALIVVCSIQTVRYAAVWTDDLTLFRWATRVEPSSTRSHHKVGEELLHDGRLGDAVRSLHRALAIAPDNRYAAETLASTERAIVERYLPDGVTPAAERPPRDPDVLHVLGVAARARGDLDGAAAWWRLALAADSSHARSHADLGVYRVVRGDTTAGVRHIEQAVRLRPTLATAWLNLARIRLVRSDSGRAAAALRGFLAHATRLDADQIEWAQRTLDVLEGR